MDFKNFVGNFFGFNQTISALQNDNLNLKYSIDDLTLQVKSALDSDLTKTAKLNELQKIVDAGGKSVKEKNYLPDVFIEASDVYKSGFWLKTEQGDSYLSPIDAGGHLCLTSFLYHIINKANLKGNETALECFNKILGAQQTYTTYILDQNQWGKTHSESWSPSVVVLNTKKDDCESLAALAVSAFEYYRMIENKYSEAYAFVGTGEYNQQYGHGFPCLYLKGTGKSFEESLFIGESTIHAIRPVKTLKEVKSTYWCNWGNNSFWHDFRIKSENTWWPKPAGTQKLVDMMTSFNPEKQRVINSFWKVGTNEER